MTASPDVQAPPSSNLGLDHPDNASDQAKLPPDERVKLYQGKLEIAQRAARIAAEHLEKAKADLRNANIDRVMALMHELDVSIEDLQSRGKGRATAESGKSENRTPPTTKARLAAKYRDPSSGEEWSGRGSVPKWLKAHEEQGRKREEFLV